APEPPMRIDPAGMDPAGMDPAGPRRRREAARWVPPPPNRELDPAQRPAQVAEGDPPRSLEARLGRRAGCRRRRRSETRLRWFDRNESKLAFDESLPLRCKGAWKPPVAARA